MDDFGPWTDDPPSPRAGSGTDLTGCAFLVVCAVVAWLASGCGASALQVHATTALVAMTAENVAEDAYLAHLGASLDGCHGDSDCVVRVNAEHAPAEAAIEVVRVAIGAYRDGIAIANAAGDSPDVIATLVAAAMRLLERWREVAAALLPLGIALPSLPGPS
jgi:hypothetical protein